MYACTTRVMLHRGNGTEGPRRWEALLLPWLREQPRFRRRLALHQDETDIGLVLMPWDTADDWAAARPGFATQAAAHLHELIDRSAPHDDGGFRLALDAG